jgi:hypothetical protein
LKCKTITCFFGVRFSAFQPFDEGTLRPILEDSSCPPFSVISLVDSQCTVASVRSFTQFGTVVVATHGGIGRNGTAYFVSGETWNRTNVRNHRVDVRKKRLTPFSSRQVPTPKFAIRTGFIARIPGRFQNSIVYMGSCSSSANNTLSNLFQGKGAKSYFGYTGSVSHTFAVDTAKKLFEELVGGLKTTGDAYTSLDNVMDPVNPNNVFFLSGSENVKYATGFENGNFETGELTSWSSQGDGRVIFSLGEFTPPQGNFRGILSTRLGFTTDAGSIEQSFCLPKTAPS